MKILYITSTPLEYNSSANMRNIAIIKGLQKLGNEVSSLSSEVVNSSIYSNDISEIINLKSRYSLKLGAIQSNITNNINQKNNFKRIIKNKIYKIYTKFSIYDPKKTLVSKVSKDFIKEKFDLVISSSDPKSSHLIAERLLDLNPNITKKWIQYWGDPFVGDINKNSIIPTKVIRREEERLIGLCDEVVYVSPFTLEQQQKNYPKYKYKMKFLPIPYIEEKMYTKVSNSKVILGYFGDYKSKDRNIEPLYDAIMKNNDFYLNICGNSDIKLEEKNNISVRPRQKINVIEELEKKSDILICICNKKGTQIPGKIYHYAATNKPILIILDGDRKKELRKYFESFNRYKLCENTEEDIIKAIKDIMNEKAEYNPLSLLSSEKIAKEFIK